MTKTAVYFGLCCLLALVGALATVCIQTLCQKETGSIQQAQAVETMTDTKRIKAAGWYVLVRKWSGIPQKGAYITCKSITKTKGSRGIKNGHLNSGDTLSFVHGKYYSGKLKLKTAKKIEYGKYTISGYSIGQLGKTKKLSRASFFKAAKKKSVYWLLAKVEKGVVVKAYWMPLSSVEMFD